MRYTARSDRGVIGADLRRSRVNILIYIWSCYKEAFASLIDETYLRKGRRWVFFCSLPRKNGGINMGLAELFILAVGLSMDAFAVSICKGVCLKKASLGQSAIVGAYFGIFQALMPIIGYFLGTGFADKIERYDHWVAFVLLLILGGKMFIESFKKEDVERDAAGNDRDELKFTKMLVLAIATSIDALAVGITLAFLKVNIWAAASFIGMTTFIISAAGVKIGHVFGEKYTNKAELAGGLILMVIGVKILLEHLGVINF